MMVMKGEKSLKIIPCALVGDGMVGKTTLALSFVNNRIPDNVYVASVFDNYAGNITVHGEQYTVSIFDTAGQHDYENVRAFSYHDSEAIIVCFSVIDRDSLQNVRDVWIPEVNRHMKRRKPLLLVGCQTDQRKDDNPDHVSEKAGSELAREIGADVYIECSAMQGSGVSQVFQTVTNLALKNRKKKTNILHRLLRRWYGIRKDTLCR